MTVNVSTNGRERTPRADPVPRWPWKSLSQIADAAVGLQDEAAAVLAEAMSDEPKGARLGRRGYAVIDGYFHLREAVLDLDASPTRDRLDRLLNYHQQVVQQSMLFAFGSPGPRTRTADASPLFHGPRRARCGTPRTCRRTQGRCPRRSRRPIMTDSLCGRHP